MLSASLNKTFPSFVPYLIETVPSVPTDCYDVMMMGKSTDAVYTITPSDGRESMDVWCEIQSEEGWLVSRL